MQQLLVESRTRAAKQSDEIEQLVRSTPGDLSLHESVLLIVRQSQKITELQLQVIQKPDLHRFVLEETQRLQSWSTRLSRKTQHRCCCRLKTYTRYSLSFQKLWDVALSSYHVDHEISCPMFASTGTEQYLKLKLSCCTSFLVGALEASTSSTRGAGGFSVAPKIRFTSVVPSDTLAFALFNFKIDGSVPLKAIEEIFDTKAGHLSRLYSEREASPLEVDKFGETVLHVGNASLIPTSLSLFRRLARS